MHKKVTKATQFEKIHDKKSTKPVNLKIKQDERKAVVKVETVPKIRSKEYDVTKIEELAAIGFTQEECAYSQGMSHETWYKYIREGKTDISDAYKRGKIKHAELIFGGLTKEAANNGKNSVTAMIFLAKAHFGRRENINLTVSGDPENPIQHQLTVNVLPAAERQAKIEELERKKREDQDDFIDAEVYKNW